MCEAYNKIQCFLQLCKCEVSITINAHKNEYMTVGEYLNRKIINGDESLRDEMEDDVFDLCDVKDTIVEIVFYNETPIGYYRVVHHDLQLAIESAINVLKEES